MGLIKRLAGIAVALIVMALVIVLVMITGRNLLSAPPPTVEYQQPERALPLPSPTGKVTEVPVQPKKDPKPEPVIKPSDIVSISIPAIGVNAKASGSIVPEVTDRCKGSEKCMDPPILDQIAWSQGFGVPASPSTNAVLVYGHSNASSQTDQVFNDLGALVKNDKIVLITMTGRFTYILDRNPMFIPFEDIPWKQSLYENTPGRLVAFTCNLSGGGYDTSAVVIAKLQSSEPL